MSRRIVPLVFALAVGACAAPASVPVGSQSQAIIGGVTDPNDPSVVLFIASQQNSNSQSLCTCEVVSPHVVITAAHCVDPATVGQGNSFQLFLGADYNNQQQANDNSNYVNIVETDFDQQFDPNQLQNGHDIAVAITQDALKLAPLPMNRIPLTQNDNGATIRFVGYGIDNGNDQQGSSAGTKRTVQTVISSYDDLLIQFNDGQHNTCEGDSGGPAFLMQGGVEVIVGITSFGDQGCVQGGDDTRVDVYAASFVDPFIAAHDPQNQQNPPPANVDMAQPNSPPQESPDLAFGNPQNGSHPDLGVNHSSKSDLSGMPGAVGAPCMNNEDCQTELCAVNGQGAGYCTEQCDPTNASSCPANLQCVALGNGNYCALNLQSSGGCTVGGAQSNALSLLGALVLLALLKRRLRAR